MALSDLSVFSEYAYSTLTEVIMQQIELFNAASRGCVSLQAAANQGDYSEVAFFKKISGLVRRRNAYGSGAVAAKDLQHLLDTMVKVAAGTPPVNLPPGQFKWIQQNPETAGAAMGQQLAGDMLADMLNIGIASCYAALSQLNGAGELVTDKTGANPDTLTVAYLADAVVPFGDHSSDIVAWISHSKPIHNLYAANITNSQNLFTYGTVNVMADPFGRVFVVSDIPGLKSSASPAVYHVLGLVPGAIRVEQNNDFTDVLTEVPGDENINRIYQAEWTYNLGIKGFAWDKSNGGHSPNDGALVVATNWDRYSTDQKDLAGVILEVN